jgi:hypothetical protein
MEDQLHINHGMIPQIPLEYSGKRQISVQFVPQSGGQTLSAMTVKCFLVNQSIVESSHPPYSPDLIQADFILFHKEKILGHRGHQE